MKIQKERKKKIIGSLCFLDESNSPEASYPFIDIGKTSFQKIMSVRKEKLTLLSLSHALLDFLMTLRSLSHGPFLLETPRLRREEDTRLFACPGERLAPLLS